ncbi:MAG: AI-2E family transporter, partial [Gammaproteobacteria bacterium]|nr:AI-2E family transporter [Gammaproteobacteria bacterium]
MNSTQLQRGVFLALLIAVSIAFGWLLLPFFGSVMWGVALAILFTPLYKRLVRKLSGRRNLAALTTLTSAMVIVIIPLVVITVSLVQQISLVSQKIRSGDINFTAYFQQVVAAIPQWLINILDRFGLGDIEGFTKQVSASAAQGTQVIASQAVNIGQNTFEFLVGFSIMVYLLFFFLRDGAELSTTVRNSLPLARPHTNALLRKFTTVIRATIKGNIAVAASQGLIGGLTFWFLGIQGALLWGVIMAFLSLLPAVGAALVWLPVAIYSLATGALMHGFVLIFVGVFVIGLVDNILRPILVGKDTQMPDY